MINPMGGFMPLDDMLMQISKPDSAEERPLAMAFINRQTELNLMDTDEGFSCGTIFRDLNKPFTAGGNSR